MEPIMTTTGSHERELANQANELTADEVEHVSGGKGGNRPSDYLVVTLKEVIVTQV
jgi:hypothetical protein